METTSRKIRNVVFSSLVVIFVVLLGNVIGLGRYFGLGRLPLAALGSMAAVFFVLAVMQIILTAKIKESKLRKTFFMLTGISAAAIPICAILHNVVYGLFFQGKDGDEAVFFILALLVCPALFVLGALGSIITGISGSLKKKE
ncbi:MAG: hypothetical protein CVV39_04050 [Planctomycetes bacterium HGW-Planctomycetes-1]|nr:MAG: hypothetical protein CVV39_04050 [Planctomycetes bacterium HGW-Planctomycetes-1]